MFFSNPDFPLQNIRTKKDSIFLIRVRWHYGSATNLSGFKNRFPPSGNVREKRQQIYQPYQYHLGFVLLGLGRVYYFRTGQPPFCAAFGNRVPIQNVQRIFFDWKTVLMPST